MRTDLHPQWVFKNIPPYYLRYLGMLLKYNHAVPWFYHLTHHWQSMVLLCWKLKNRNRVFLKNDRRPCLQIWCIFLHLNVLCIWAVWKWNVQCVALKGQCSITFEDSIPPTLNPTLNLTNSVSKGKNITKSICCSNHAIKMDSSSKRKILSLITHPHVGPNP